MPLPVEPETDRAVEGSPSRNIDPELLTLLRCPLTRSRLTQRGDWLIAEVGGLAYPVRDGIPVMMVEEARLPEGVTTLDDFRQRYASAITAS